jgi:CRP-like cAMP-binding protein
MENLPSFLARFYPVNPAILEEYVSYWKPVQVQKKQIMRSAGEVEKSLYYVLKGVQKSYFHFKEREHIIAFAYPPSFSGIPESFFTQTPSRYYLEAISDSELLKITYEEHEKFISRHREMETLFRKVTESFLDGVIQRQHEIMALNSEDRFRAFVKRSAPLLQLIPQKDIASYLKIDPSNFSKLINQIKI